jgi:POTRA domain-containing FtsQ-type protein
VSVRRSRAPIAGRRSRRSAADERFGWLLNPARVAAAVLLVGCVAGIGWLVTADDFELDPSSLELSGIRYTDPAVVSAILAPQVSGGQSAFLIDTTAIRAELLALPTVATAEVRTVLPHRLVVVITERLPVLAVRHAGAVYLLDGDGVVLDDRALDTTGLEGLAPIDDQRITSAITYTTGETVNSIDTRAMLTLAALTPTLLGSSSTALRVSIDDSDGYVVTAAPYGWRAVFGHYTPTLRPPSEIDRQVQCLETILADGEAALDTVYLAPDGDRCGTYLPLPTTSPTPS